MGTNYYFKPPNCLACGRDADVGKLHIGKSSVGWCFALHVIPDPDIAINDLPDWIALWKARDHWHIEDENGQHITIDDMIRIITVRKSTPESKSGFDYARNSAVPGPHNLARHALGPHCVRHGAGTWDLIPGEFF